MKAIVFCSLLAIVRAAHQVGGSAVSQYGGSAASQYGGSDSDDLESVPYKTLNKTIDGDLAFEIREYPSVKWVCTDMTYKVGDKPSGMFMRLFRYISGVNAERQEVAMTSPVLSKLVPNQSTGEMKNRMCFYLDSAAQANPPTPEEETVYLMTSAPLKVAVYEFGGYAMEDSVWMKTAGQFANALGERAKSLITDSYYTAGYDSPMKFFNRRNEVMFELKP